MAVEHDPAEEGKGAGFPRAALACLAVLLGCGYLATYTPASDGQVLGNDAISYARAVVTGDSGGILLANHLLPHVLARVLFLAGSSIGLVAPDLEGALLVQQALSALGAAVSALLVLHLAQRFSGSRLVGALCAALFATAAGPWLYAAVGETYLLAVAAEAWVLTETLRARGSVPYRLRLGLAIAIALLVRQDALFVLVVPALVLRQKSLAPLMGGCAAAAGVFVLAWLASPTSASLVTYSSGIAGDDAWSIDAPRADFGFAVLVHTVMTIDAFVFGLHRVANEPLAALAPLGACALLAAALWRGRRSASGRGASGCAVALGAYFALRFGFFTWWQPSNIEYAVGHLLPLLLLAAHVFAERSAKLIALAIVVAGTSNAVVLIAPFVGRGADSDASALFAAVARSGDRTEAGALVALDPWSLLALRRTQRAGDIVLDATTALDAERVRWIADEIRRHVDAGRSVIAVSDASFATRLGLPPVEPDPALAAALIEIVPFQRLLPGAALQGYRLAREGAPD